MKINHLIERLESLIGKQVVLSVEDSESSAKKAYMMTLQEYQTVIVPVLQEYRKFLKRNSKFFVKKDFDGLQYVDWEVFKEKELERTGKSIGKQLSAQDQSWVDFIEKRWREKSGADIEQASPELIKQKDELISRLSEFLDPIDIQKFDNDEFKSNKRTIKRASEDGRIVSALLDQEVKPEEVQQIFDSVGVKVPRHVLQMKDKVVNQGYTRSAEQHFTQRSKEFAEALQIAFKPHAEQIKDSFKRPVERVVQEYIDSNLNNVSRFAEYKTHSRAGYQELTNTLYRYTTGKQKVANYDQKLDEEAAKYAEAFIVRFQEIVQEKLKVVNSKWGAAEFTVNNVSFGKGIATGSFTASYSNKQRLGIQAEIIFAGGYNIQREHLRYLVKIFHNGKEVSLQQLDSGLIEKYTKKLQQLTGKQVKLIESLNPEMIRCPKCGAIKKVEFDDSGKGWNGHCKGCDYSWNQYKLKKQLEDEAELKVKF